MLFAVDVVGVVQEERRRRRRKKDDFDSQLLQLLLLLRWPIPYWFVLVALWGVDHSRLTSGSDPLRMIIKKDDNAHFVSTRIFNESYQGASGTGRVR
jgi:hypothetical protein